ncbi:MAG: hypothetical protein RSB41_00960 [Bacilli bacterium]
MDELFNTNPRVTTALSALIGYILIDNLTANEQNALGNWIILIGQILVTNSTSQILIENRVNSKIINLNKKEVKEKYNPFIYDIEHLKEVIASVDPSVINTFMSNIKEKTSSLDDFLSNLH